MGCAESLRVQAYFDGEVDAVSAADLERHAEHCAECRALLRDLEQTRTAIRRDLTPGRAPPELRARIMHALDRETAVDTPRPRRWGRTSWRTRPFWMGALGGLGSAAVAATLFLVLSPSLTNPLLDDLLSAHVRSLMPSHLIDVVSSGTCTRPSARPAPAPTTSTR